MAQRVSFKDFPDSKLDNISDHLAAMAQTMNVPVSADSSDTSLQSATGSKKRIRRPSATGSLEVGKLPKQKRKPPAVAGCYWTSDWKLRRSIRDANDNNPFIGQLSEGKFKELKAAAKQRQLPVAEVLTEWAKLKAAEKGIQL